MELTMQVYETAGDSLQGAIDGANVTYTTSLPFDADSVQVFFNGLNKVASLDDGFSLQPPNKVVVKEARQAGDTVAVCYTIAGRGSIGGQLGGVPPPLSVSDVSPTMLVEGEDPVLPPATLSLQSPPLWC